MITTGDTAQMQSGGTSVSPVQPGGDARRSTGRVRSAAKARCANSSRLALRCRREKADLLHYVFGFLGALLHALAGRLSAFFHALPGVLGSGLSGIAGF